MTEQGGEHSVRATLDRDLQSVRADLLDLGERVDRAIAAAMQALRKQDDVLASEVVDGDARINKLRFDIEEKCLQLIATQQPTASDLRAVVAAMNIVSDLERMGDHAVGIANAVLRMGDDPAMEIPEGMEYIASQVREMLRMGLEAYRDKDLNLAHEVAGMDDEIDVYYRRLFRELLEYMSANPEKTGAAVRLQFASHNLERIADRTTNLVERVIFQSSGEMQELNPEPDETGMN
jgi:phosphate transport system protein